MNIKWNVESRYAQLEAMLMVVCDSPDLQPHLSNALWGITDFVRFCAKELEEVDGGSQGNVSCCNIEDNE